MTRMKTTLLGCAAMCCAVVVSPALAQHEGSEGERQHAGTHTDKPINAMCPIGKEPIVRSAGTVEYKERTIGLCCPSCAKEFMAWPEAKRDEFVRVALAGKEPGQEHHAQHVTTQIDKAKSDLYTLDICPISGQKLGSMGDPVVKEIDGREVRFCCAGCVEPFEKEKTKHFAEIDKTLSEQQLPYYPFDTCVVMGDPLVEAGEDIAVNHVYKNRLVRFCCKMCIRKFNEDPRAFLEKLDKEVVERQREHYPLDTCMVSGQKLGSMGEPVEKVYGNRLARFCCAGCIKSFEENPTAHIQRFDTAWKAMHDKHGNAGKRHHNDSHVRGEVGHDHSSVEQYGAMREVLREGHIEPRVQLADVVADPNTFAVGALAGLEGEITIVDGSVWVTRTSEDNLAITGPHVVPGDHATLLTAAHVPDWTAVQIDGTISGTNLEALIDGEARESGIDTNRPFPFMLEGSADEIAIHVINGYCPMAADPASTNAQPWRWSGEKVSDVIIVGFYAADSAGVMTHHDSSIHAHAVLTIDGKRLTGHIDYVRTSAGTILRLPGPSWPHRVTPSVRKGRHP